MLQAHSILWHYLWVAPNILLLVLALLVWSRGLHKKFPIFFAFAIIGSVAQISVYAADVIPSVRPETFWRVFWIDLLVEALLKFSLIGEIFAHVFGPYPSLARLGRLLIRGVGVALVLSATLAAAYAQRDSPYWTIAGAHILEQTIYIIECGLLLFIFLFSAYFKLSSSRPVFGIAVGLSISSCVHLANWAIAANGGLNASQRSALDFINMFTYHACVLLWFYYLLVPHKFATKSAVSIPEHSLEMWNRELERFLQP